MVGIVKSMKRGGGGAARVLRSSRRKRQEAGGNQFFDTLRFGKIKPGKTSSGVWVCIVMQSWDSHVFERGELILEEGRLWHNHVSHYAPGAGRNGMGFDCSSGPERDKPCYGCAEYIRVRMETDEMVADIRNRHDDNEATKKLIDGLYKGMKDKRKIGTSKRCAFSVVVLENILEVQKDNSKYTRNVIESLATPADHKNAVGSHEFGKFVYDVSGIGKDQLMALQDQVRNTCANCGDHLEPIGIECGNADCEEVLEVDPSDFRDRKGNFDIEAFTNFLEVVQECGSCGSRLQFDELLDPDTGNVPYTVVYDCEGCSEPVEGSIVNLGLRIAERKITDTTKEIVLLDAAPLPKELTEELMEPLNLNKFKKGDPVDRQAKKLGKLAADLDPSFVTMPDNTEDEDEEDEEGYDE